MISRRVALLLPLLALGPALDAALTTYGAREVGTERR